MRKCEAFGTGMVTVRHEGKHSTRRVTERHEGNMVHELFTVHI